MRTLLACLFMLTACGDDGGNQLPDAPIAADAAPDAAPNTPVTLTITLDGLPVPDIDVYFLDPDSSLVAKVVTSATGVASAVVITGGSVTAVNPFVASQPTVGGPAGIHRELRTFTGVKPGDQLRLAETGGRSTAISVTVSAPADGQADGYVLYASCGGNGQSLGGGGSGSGPMGTIGLSGCGGMTDLILVSSTQGVDTGWIYKANVPVADLGTIDLTAETYALPTDVTMTINNVPQQFPNVVHQTSLASPRGELWNAEANVAAVAGTAMDTVRRPSNAQLPTSALLSLSRARMFTSMTGYEAIFWGPQAASMTFDLATNVLPEFTAAPVVALPAHTVSWTSAGGAPPDLTVMGIYVTNQADSYDWELAAPYGATSVTFPTLPSGVLPFVATASDSSNVDFLATAKVPGGYDAVRANILSVGDPAGLVFGASGVLSTAIYELNK